MTDESVNEQIRRRTEGNISYYKDHPEEIPVRLEELDRRLWCKEMKNLVRRCSQFSSG